MSTALAQRGEALPSLEKARALLTQCRSVQECQRIKAVAQAVASCSAAERSRDEAAAIVLLAKARIGELTEALPRAVHGGKGGGSKVPSGNSRKSDALEADGLSRKEAAECEKIAALKKSGDLDRMLAKSKTSPTTAAAVALQRLAPEQRRQVFAKLGDSPDVRKAIGEVKLAQKRELAEEIRSNPIVTPDGRYQDEKLSLHLVIRHLPDEVEALFQRSMSLLEALEKPCSRGANGPLVKTDLPSHHKCA